MKRKSNFISFAAGSFDARAAREGNVIGARLAALRRERGLTLAELGRRLAQCGVTVSAAAVGKWESGDTVPNAYQLAALGRILGTDSLADFIGEGASPLNAEGLRRVAEYREDLIASGRYRPASFLPEEDDYIEMDVSRLPTSAGRAVFLTENRFEKRRVRRAEVPDGAQFGIFVSGDSMEPRYHDGQIVWVRGCPSLQAGEVGIFVYDGEGYVKIYQERTPPAELRDAFTDSTGVLRMQPVLASVNPAYAPIPVSPEAPFRILGRVL